jgi:hypothetical protein
MHHGENPRPPGYATSQGDCLRFSGGSRGRSNSPRRIRTGAYTPNRDEVERLLQSAAGRSLSS